MGRVYHMAATVVLLMDSLHQVALDGGDWHNGALILVRPDPMSRPEFGASHETLTHIAARRRALAELRKKQTGANDVEKDDKDATEPKGKANKK